MPAPFTFTAFADVGTDDAPTEPRFAWSRDPAVVEVAGAPGRPACSTTTTTTRPTPVAGATGTDRTPAVTMTNLPSTQNPRFTLLAGDICYADPGGSGPPAEDTKPTPARQERRQPLCVGRLPEPDREPPSTPSATRQVTKVPEKITWSQVPYDDYAFIAVDVVPAAPGSVAAVTIRCLADALPGSGQPYSEIDRVTLQRTAGQGAITGAAPPLTRHRH